jgi:hypothetical protein
MYVVSVVYKQIGIKVGDRAVYLDAGGLADGCVGILHVFETYEEAEMFAEYNTTLIIELEQKEERKESNG